MTELQKWTKEEIDTLKKWYGKLTVQDIQNTRLHNRSLHAIRMKASKMRISNLRSDAKNYYNDLQKRCSKCKIVKDKKHFSRNKNTLSGLGICSECTNRSSRKRYTKNKNLIIKNQQNRHKRNYNEWKEFFIEYYGESPSCEVCGRDLKYFAKIETDKSLSVNWDHTHDDVAVGVQPSSWLRSHLCNQDNRNLWLSFGFGILCTYCNGSLPTKGRTEWLQKALDYTRKNNVARIQA